MPSFIHQIGTIQLSIDAPSIFPAEIVAGITCRGAVADGSIGFTVKESEFVCPSEALRNRSVLASAIGLPDEQVLYRKQTHSIIIDDIGSGENSPEADGLISSVSGVALAIKVADCAAVMMYDRERKVVCGLHSGWRGTAQNIVREGIAKMSELHNSHAKDIVAWVAPCAGGDAYEVGEEVAKFFPRSTRPIGNGKFLFDNRSEIRLQLLDCGLHGGNIELSDVCTIGNEDYHSYRRDGAKSGRMAAFICMK